MKTMHKNPVYELDGEFYFYDETWANSCGPFFSEYSAHLMMQKYVKIFLG